MNKELAPVITDLENQINDIQTDIAAIEHNTLLFEERNFDKRTDTLDFIDFHILDRIEGVLPQTDQQNLLLSLKNRAEQLRTKLEAVDAGLFQKIQDNIRSGAYTSESFKSMVREFVHFDSTNNEYQGEVGYDNLDVFLNGIFSFKNVPEQTLQREPGMVFYQKTPARIIFEMLDKVDFTNEDVFFDLGSGLGFVIMLVNLLSGVKTIGVEFEPAFCNYAINSIASLNLSNIKVINVDAREADYSSGNIFFMYTPFDSHIIHDVLDLLKKEALSREIKIITYGPCSINVALQSWLKSTSPNENINKLMIFNSL
ncbi:class I SAM-dependent methyltransferase [Mucilaginibacter jinjuensis]|uniref:Class I SAM-dependent methyltransferase n=1 Tax=Mucilaginibacter jinjuensis TaxID=1176721 RepID=A0ABY7T984_9SPHI|nr:class I SAM-dependent methyltransferase [Mucilaginibacter jinjuensis]WCT12456.1 class I SAM-dependent methyltransferase [Mucilaginibacter jinjuensis]